MPQFLPLDASARSIDFVIVDANGRLRGGHRLCSASFDGDSCTCSYVDPSAVPVSSKARAAVSAVAARLRGCLRLLFLLRRVFGRERRLGGIVSGFPGALAGTLGGSVR